MLFYHGRIYRISQRGIQFLHLPSSFFLPSRKVAIQSIWLYAKTLLICYHLLWLVENIFSFQH